MHLSSFFTFPICSKGQTTIEWLMLSSLATSQVVVRGSALMILLVGHCQLLMPGHHAPHPQGSRPLCKTSWTTTALQVPQQFLSQMRCKWNKSLCRDWNSFPLSLGGGRSLTAEWLPHCDTVTTPIQCALLPSKARSFAFYVLMHLIQATYAAEIKLRLGYRYYKCCLYLLVPS